MKGQKTENRGQRKDNKLDREHYVDIHCHCLPGLDDGPATMSESLALCRALVDEDTTTVIATPHQLGRFSECNDVAQIKEVVLSVNEELRSNAIALRVVPGADVRVDERICRLLEEDKVLTLADGGKYILLELPARFLLILNHCLLIWHLWVLRPLYRTLRGTTDSQKNQIYCLNGSNTRLIFR